MALLQGMGKGVPASKAALEALEARDMLDGIEYKANEKMASSDELEIMSPKLEDQGYLTFYKHLRVALLWQGGDRKRF